MAIKKSVYLSTPTQKWIEETANGKWSESINATFDQIRYLIENNCPELNTLDWTELDSVYKDDRYPAHRADINIAADLMRYYNVVDTSELHDKKRKLIKRMRELTYIEQLAVLYTIQGDL